MHRIIASRPGSKTHACASTRVGTLARICDNTDVSV